MNFPLPRFALASLGTVALLVGMLAFGAFGEVQGTGFGILFFAALVTQALSIILAARFLISVTKFESLISRIFLGSAVVIFALISVANSLVPVTARDALIHHIFVAQQWSQTGTIAGIPGHEWSHYAQLLQVFYAGAERFSLVPLTILFHASYLFLAAVLVSHLCKIFGASASLGATVMLTIPVLLQLSGEPLVDLSLLYAVTLALAAVTCRAPSWVIAAAFAMAMGCKPNGFLAVALLLPVIAIMRQQPRQIVSILVFTVLFYSPIGVWCYAQSGNPIFPFAKNIFAGANAGAFAGVNAEPIFRGFSVLEQRIYLYGESLREAALVPVRIFFQGQEGVPQYFDGVLPPILILGFLGVFFVGREKAVGSNTDVPSQHRGATVAQKEVLGLTAYSLLYLLVASMLTVMRIRYMVPILPGLAVGTSLIFSSRKILVPLAQLFCIGFAVYENVYDDEARALKLGYLAGTVSEQEYLEQRIPEYPVIQFANTQLPVDAKISLILTGNQFALYQRSVLPSGQNSADALLAILRKSNTTAEVEAGMRQQGITTIIVNQASLFEVLASTPELSGKADLFKAAFQPIYESRGFVVAQVSQE